MSVLDFGTHEVAIYPPIVPNDAHVYEAGNTGSETPLSKGKIYRLRGVKPNGKPPRAKLHPEDNGVFPRHSILPGSWFCKIIMPIPDEIVPLNLTPIPSSDPYFQGSPSPYQQPTAIADLNVFRYTVTGPVSLNPLPWTPIAQNGIANLQLFAMPAGPVASTHPAEAFKAMAQMMGYPNLKQNQDYGLTQAPPPDAHPPVPGVSTADELGLVERKKAANRGKAVDYATSAFNCLSLFMY
jgi:hypothetical protein